MSPKLVTAIVLILTSCRASLDPELRAFLLQYLGDQGTPAFSRFQTKIDIQSNDRGVLWMPFHLRCFGKVQNLGKRTEHISQNITCRRYKAIDLGIREKQRSLALLCPFMKGEDAETENTSNYVILRLLDDGWHDFKFDDNFSTCGLPLCKPWTGITMLQRLIWGELDWWESSWAGVLNTIDNLVAFEVCVHPSQL